MKITRDETMEALRMAYFKTVGDAFDKVVNASNTLAAIAEFCEDMERLETLYDDLTNIVVSGDTKGS